MRELDAHQSKICAACGRKMAWRPAWARNWHRMRYCSDRCRRHRGTGRIDHELERAMIALLDRRHRGATICPSEAARQVSPSHWRRLSQRSRQAARRLAARGLIEIVRQGVAVDPSTARGPIRLRRVDRK